MSNIGDAAFVISGSISAAAAGTLVAIGGVKCGLWLGRKIEKLLQPDSSVLNYVVIGVLGATVAGLGVLVSAGGAFIAAKGLANLIGAVTIIATGTIAHATMTVLVAGIYSAYMTGIFLLSITDKPPAPAAPPVQAPQPQNHAFEYCGAPNRL